VVLCNRFSVLSYGFLLLDMEERKCAEFRNGCIRAECCRPSEAIRGILRRRKKVARNPCCRLKKNWGRAN
jgi:hypothetical protein